MTDDTTDETDRDGPTHWPTGHATGIIGGAVIAAGSMVYFMSIGYHPAVAAVVTVAIIAVAIVTYPYIDLAGRRVLERAGLRPTGGNDGNGE